MRRLPAPAPTFALPALALLALALLASCTPLELDPPAPYAFVVYDPGSGEIPLPNDAVRDMEAGRLDLSTTRDGLTPTDVALREWLNTTDGWGTATAGSLRFSEAVDPETVGAGTVQVFEWGNQPTRVDVELELEDDGRLGIVPPRAGWIRGGRYVVVVRGGPDGVRTAAGGDVGPDAAMYYLRLDERLDTDANQRAFSGTTRAARLETAASMERIRARLAPAFDHLATVSPEYLRIPRDEIAALFDFTVTEGTELAMDRASQRVPLPFDLLLDPETGLVDLPTAEWDTELEADAKVQLSKLNGFGLSANLTFELTGPVDPATATTETVRLWDLAQTPVEVALAEVRVFADAGEEPCREAPVDDDCKRLVVRLAPEEVPLRGASTYALVVSTSLRDARGEPVQPMPMGALLRGDAPIAVGGVSAVSSLDDATAVRLESVRAKVDALLDAQGRGDVLAAWPFTTLDALPALRADVVAAETLAVDPTPVVESRKPAYALFGDHALASLFPGVLNPGPEIYALRTLGIAEVVEGTIQTPYLLDPITRRRVPEGEHEVRPIRFLATVPEGAALGEPLPVVIFGHAIVTDRRFLLTIGGRLAREGYAAVAIDWPFHGDRIACVDASLVATPNFLPPALQTLTGLTDELLYFPPCVSGDDATCAPTGECLDANGEPEPFSSFPIMDLKPVGGAAFMDMSDLPHIAEHFSQALVDVGALRRSLREADWSEVFGRPVRTDTVHYAGQSLGSLIGSVYVAVDPTIDRAVFNVPGSDMVSLFLDSTYFGPQIDAFLRENDIEPGSWDEERLLNIAGWLIDTVDPHTVAHLYRDDGRPALIQIDRVADGVGDVIIPNHTTEALQRISGLPMIAYPSVLHADLIVPGLGNAMLNDMADFLSGDLQP